MPLTKMDVSLKQARKVVLAYVTGRKKPFSSLSIHVETGLPFNKINKILDEFEKEGKVEGRDEDD